MEPTKGAACKLLVCEEELGISSLEYQAWNIKLGISSLEYQAWNIKLGISSLEYQGEGGPLGQVVDCP